MKGLHVVDTSELYKNSASLFDFRLIEIKQLFKLYCATWTLNTHSEHPFNIPNTLEQWALQMYDTP